MDELVSASIGLCYALPLQLQLALIRVLLDGSVKRSKAETEKANYNTTNDVRASDMEKGNNATGEGQVNEIIERHAVTYVPQLVSQRR